MAEQTPTTGTGTTGSVDRDRIRTDVAAALGEEPQDVGDDDDLFDLGLDSIRLMSLVEQWRGETGLRHRLRRPRRGTHRRGLEPPAHRSVTTCPTPSTTPTAASSSS